MVRKLNEIDLKSPELIGKFVLFQTVMIHGTVGNPCSIVNIGKSNITAVVLHRHRPSDSVSEKRVKAIKNVLFVCDTVEEAWSITDITDKCMEDHSALDKKCRDDTEALVAELNRLPDKNST